MDDSDLPPMVLPFQVFILNRIPRCETKLLFLHVWPAEFKKPIMSWQVMIWVKDLVNHYFHLFKRKLWCTTGSFGKKTVVSLGINRLVSMQVIQKKREQQLDDWKVRCVGWLTPQDAEIVFRHVETTAGKHEAVGKWWGKGWSIKQSWLAFPCVSDSILCTFCSVAPALDYHCPGCQHSPEVYKNPKILLEIIDMSETLDTQYCYQQFFFSDSSHFILIASMKPGELQTDTPPPKKKN